MVYYGQYRPGMVSDDLRSEFDLSPDTHRHVEWLCSSGMLNREDLRSMRSRQSNIERYGIDMRKWP